MHKVYGILGLTCLVIAAYCIYLLFQSHTWNEVAVARAAVTTFFGVIGVLFVVGWWEGYRIRRSPIP